MVHTWVWLTETLSAGLVPHQLLSGPQQLLFQLYGLEYTVLVMGGRGREGEGGEGEGREREGRGREGRERE